MHVYTGVSDCEGIIKEQASARMVFPGPLPVIRTGSKARCLAVSSVFCSALQCVAVSLICSRSKARCLQCVAVCCSVASSSDVFFAVSTPLPKPRRWDAKEF